MNTFKKHHKTFYKASKKHHRMSLVLITLLLVASFMTTAFIPGIAASGEMLQSSENSVQLAIGATQTTRDINQVSTSVLRWSAEIENDQKLDNLTYVGSLVHSGDSCSMEYVTSLPILLTLYQDGSIIKQIYYYWTSDNVTLSSDSHSVSILLPDSTNYDAYSIDYYTTYQGTDYDYRVEGTVLQRVDGEDQVLASAQGEYVEEITPPKINVSIYGDDNGISYQAKVIIPSGNQGMKFYTGGGVTVEKDGETIVIPISVEEVSNAQVTITTQSETIKLSQYAAGGGAENTYNLAVNQDDTNVYSFDMVFNTDEFDVGESYWNVNEEAELEIKLTIPTSAADSSGKTIAEYLAEGYTITNHFFGRFAGYGLSEGTATYSVVVQKSSNLNDFVTSANIYDSQNVLQYGETATGETVNNPLKIHGVYIYELTFEERNNLGDYVEMKPDEEGYMTYTIPTQISPLGDDLTPQEITLSNGKAVAEFFIKDRTIKLKFYDVDENGDSTPGTSWIDSPGLKKIKLRFEGSFSGGASDTIDLNLGEDLIVNVALVDDSDLNVEKKAGDYDPTTHTVAYTVTVSGAGNHIEGLTLTDTITSGNGAIVAGSITAKVGDQEKAAPTCTLREDGSCLISNLPDLNPNEILTVEYLVHIDDDVAAYALPTGSVRLSNTVVGRGNTPQGLSLSDTDTAQKDITVKNLTKSGYCTTLNNGTTSVIQWTATVGDGSYDVGGVLLEDVLGSYLTLYQDKPITVEAVTRSGTVSSITIQWTNAGVKLSDGEGAFQLTLPSSSASDPYTLFRVRYYTTYEVQESFTTYYNTVKASPQGKEMEVTGKCSIAPVGNATVVKTGERDGDYLTWTITAELPAGLYGTQGVYLTGYCDGVGIQENGTLLYKSADLSNAIWDVTVETESGEVIHFNPYKGNGITENTYSIAWNNRYQNDKYNNTRAILFNCTGQNTWDSTWLINEASTITVQMRVPITNEVTSSGTAEEILDNGGYISNIAVLYIAGSEKSRSTGIINGVPLHKSGAQSTQDGVIDYSVILRNSDRANNSAVMTAKQTQDMEFIDTFDQRLEYVEGSLKLELKKYETSSSPGDLVDTFYYRGDVSADGSLVVTAEQFVNDAGKTLKEYAAAQSGTTWYNFFFSYQLKVKDEYKDMIATKLQLDNTAMLRWGTDDTEYLTAEETITYKTGLLTKATVDAPQDGETLGNGNVLKYQIELNPRALDLDVNSDVLVVLDTLPNCLNVIWDNDSQVNIIGEYWDDASSSWVAFNSSTDAKTWQKGYYYDTELEQNVLRFQVPDQLRVRITYQCQVTEYGTNVQIVNQVSILGQARLEDSVESIFNINEKAGTAESNEQQFTIIKTDVDTHEPMENVTFVLYSLESRTNRTPDDSAIATEITGTDGRTYYYFGTYTTDENGYCLVQVLGASGKYILREYKAPEGYEKIEDKYIQYSENPLDASQVTSPFENVFKNQTLSIGNRLIRYELPNTGGSESAHIYAIALLLLMSSTIGVLLIHRQKHRA